MKGKVILKNLDFEKMAYNITENFKQNRFKKPKFGKTRSVNFPAFLVDELQEYVVCQKKEGLKKGLGGKVDLLFIDPDETGSWPCSQQKI